MTQFQFEKFKELGLASRYSGCENNRLGVVSLLCFLVITHPTSWIGGNGSYNDINRDSFVIGAKHKMYQCYSKLVLRYLYIRYVNNGTISKFSICPGLHQYLSEEAFHIYLQIIFASCFHTF